MQALRNAKWHALFPSDYRWSFNTAFAMASIKNGGADMGEVDAVVRRLVDHVGDDDKWFDEWTRLGLGVELLGDEALKRGLSVTAGEHYRRAGLYQFVAERFKFPKTPESLEAYRHAVATFKKALALSDPGVEYVGVPFPGGALPAIYTPAPPRNGKKPPVAVLYSGFDGNKELNWIVSVPQMVARGMSVLSVDTPGVGEAIRFGGHHLRHDYEVVGSACIDYLESRDDVDAARVGIIAMSLGGYYAPRAASLEPRFKACVAWGAQWDYHEIWKKRVEAAYDMQLPVPGDHLMWSTNAGTPEEALRRIEGFRLDGVVQKMRCPFLVCHGDDDQQIPTSFAQKLYDASGSPDKELKVFGIDEGATQHCNFDNLSIAGPYMFDWLADKLGA